MKVLRKLLGTLLMVIVAGLSLPLMTLALLLSALATIFGAAGKGILNGIIALVSAVGKIGGWEKDKPAL